MGGGTDFQTIATSLTSAITIAKVIINAEQTFDKAELKLKLADLMVALADARTQLSEMQDATYRLADELSAAKKKLDFAGTMKFQPPYYINVANEEKDGPYCATCWDGRDKLAVHLYQAVRGYWKCHTCESEVRDSTYRDPPPIGFAR